MLNLLNTTPTFVYAMFIAFGACLGSFAALVIDRLPDGTSIVTPRSRCNSCGKTIKFWQNIPLISWILLRGRCFFCRSSIGVRPLLVEVIFAIGLVAIFSKFGLSGAAIERVVFLFLLVCLAYIDLDTFYLPNILLYSLFVFGLISSLYYYLNPDSYVVLSHEQPVLKHLIYHQGFSFSLYNRLLGATLGLLSLSIINLIASKILRRTGRLKKSQWAMGWGDPILVMGIGIYVGFSHLFATIFLASILGSVAGIAQKLSKKVEKGDGDIADGAIPFGPFLSVAAIYVYLF